MKVVDEIPHDERDKGLQDGRPSRREYSLVQLRLEEATFYHLYTPHAE